MIDLLTGLLIVALVALSAFFSSAEIAFAKANRVRMKKAADDGDKAALAAEYINDRYTASLSTILVGNNLVNIAESSAATLLATRYLGLSLGQTVATVGSTVILLIFGETLPKIVAADQPDAVARLYGKPLRLFMILFSPIVTTVTAIVHRLEKLWTPKEEEEPVSTEELCEILEDIEEEGVFTEEESELIKSAIEFTDITAREILTPRVDVFALDIDDPDWDMADELLRHSRVPVYEDTIDHIIGILPTKRFMKEVLSGHPFDLRELLTEPLFVHQTRTISSIIREFRRLHTQMAVVLDEYGGTLGILTMEDITEEIVGEIYDERDEVEQEEAVRLSDTTFEVEGSMNIYDLFDAIGYEPEDFDTEYTTVSGWATEMLDKFPEPGDSFTCGRIQAQVLSVDERVVETLRVTLTPEEKEEE